MWLYKIFRTILFVFFKIFCGFKVKGKSHIPAKGGFILASNHQSILDPMILGVASSRPLNFMAKKDLFRNFLFGSLIRTVGAFPVERDTADISAIKEAISRLKRGKALVIFPQGTRNKNKLQVQPGIGLLASKAGCPVLPAFISGSGQAIPRNISVRFGKALNFTKEDSYENIANKVMKEIISLKERSQL